MRNASTESRHQTTLMAWIRRSISPISYRSLIGVTLILIAMVSTTLYRVLLVTESYADFRYWTPSDSDADDKLLVQLHWKPEVDLNPVVRTQGCSVDMSVDPPEYNPTKNIRLSELTDDLTVVTAYFYIPEYKKRGSSSKFSTRDLYRQWMSAFMLIENQIIAYVDNAEDYDYFRSARRHFPLNRTCLVQLNRTRMWAFSSANRKRVKSITHRDDYFEFYPNTVIADYSLTQNAKYEVMQMSIRRNPYRTRYITWLDIGLFRGITTPPSRSTSSASDFADVEAPPGQPHFRLGLPPGFDCNRSIAFSEVHVRDETLSPKTVIFYTKVWVSGAYFVGRVDRMYQWTRDYAYAYEWLIKNNLTNTDEQVIYALYNAVDQRILRPPKSKLQVYKSDDRFNKYFTAGYQSRVILYNSAMASRSSTWLTLLAIGLFTMILSVIHPALVESSSADLISV